MSRPMPLVMEALRDLDNAKTVLSEGTLKKSRDLQDSLMGLESDWRRDFRHFELLRSLREDITRARRSKFQWAIVLPVAFMWLAIGFAVEGYVGTDTGESFLEYWASGAPPLGVNQFLIVAMIEGALLLFVGVITTTPLLDRFSRSELAHVLHAENVLAFALDADRSMASNAGSGEATTSVSSAPNLSGENVAEIARVLDVWGEMEPAVARFIDVLQTTPPILAKEVAGLATTVRALEGPVATMVEAVEKAHISVGEIAGATESTVRKLDAVAQQGAQQLDETVRELLLTTRRLNKEMEPLVETMMILKNVLRKEGQGGG